jgi:hypothetical protein
LNLPEPLRALPGDEIAGVAAAKARLQSLGVAPSAWSNGPGDRYGAHEHITTKLLVCAEGSITFLVGSPAVAAELRAGQGFELPAGTRHAAVVGPEGCTCVEGHRR